MLKNMTVYNCFLCFNYLFLPLQTLGFPRGSVVKDPACQTGDSGKASLIPGLGRSSGGGNDHPLHIFAWDSPCTEECCRLQSMGYKRVR